MKIYNYHPITKEYLGESTADESPLEPEVFLIPANATRIIPPEIGENQTAVFENNEWVIKPDFRGKIYYNKSTRQQVIIDFIGNIPDTLQKTKPPLPLYELKQMKKQENEAAITGKTFFNTSFGNLGLDTIVGSLSTVLGNYMILNLPDYTGMLYTFEGESIPDLNNERFKALYQEVLQKYLAFDARARQIRTAIENSTEATIQNILTYDADGNVTNYNDL